MDAFNSGKLELKMFDNMKMHTQKPLNKNADGAWITRVPGGWIYTFSTITGGQSAVFVPRPKGEW